MMQSAGKWYFNADGTLNILDNAPLKAALATYGKIWQADIVKPVSGWNDFTGAFTSGDTAVALDGVWMTGTIKSKPEQSGKWGVAPIPKLDGIDGATHYSNEGGSSWYVLSSAPSKDAAIDFLKTVWGGDKDFYQKILVGQGAVRLAASPRVTAMPTSRPTPSSAASRCGRTSPIGSSKIPGVDYGIFTAEVDAAVVAQLPAIAKGGSVDDALKAINDQADTADAVTAPGTEPLVSSPHAPAAAPHASGGAVRGACPAPAGRGQPGAEAAAMVTDRTDALPSLAGRKGAQAKPAAANSSTAGCSSPRRWCCSASS